MAGPAGKSLSFFLILLLNGGARRGRSATAAGRSPPTPGYIIRRPLGAEMDPTPPVVTASSFFRADAGGRRGVWCAQWIGNRWMDAALDSLWCADKVAGCEAKSASTQAWYAGRTRM
nr:hypothetical protein SEVIR_5G439400v2 [Setaria viridis]